MGTMSHAAIVIGALIGSYLLFWLAEYVVRLLIGAPKAIYAVCLADTASIKEQSCEDMRKAREDFKKYLEEREESFAIELRGWAERNSEIGVALRDCNEQLAQKHPADEFKEQEIRGWLKQFTQDELGVIRWLWNQGEADAHEFGALKVAVNIRGSALSKGIDLGLVRFFPKGTGTAHKINEEYREALKNVLYPRTR
jgi:hypothetical protein